MSSRWMWVVVAAVTVAVPKFLVGCGGGSGGAGPVLSPDPPTLAVTAPLPGASVSQGTVVDIAVSVSAPAGVDRVVFLIDAVNRGTDDAAPFTYEWHTAAEAIGDHVIEVTVFDQFTPPRSASALRTVSVVRPEVPRPVYIEMSVNAIRLFWNPVVPSELELECYEIHRSVNWGLWQRVDDGGCGRFCIDWSDLVVSSGNVYRYRIRAVYTNQAKSEWAAFDAVLFTGT